MSPVTVKRHLTHVYTKLGRSQSTRLWSARSCGDMSTVRLTRASVADVIGADRFWVIPQQEFLHLCVAR